MALNRSATGIQEEQVRKNVLRVGNAIGTQLPCLQPPVPHPHPGAGGWLSTASFPRQDRDDGRVSGDMGNHRCEETTGVSS